QSYEDFSDVMVYKQASDFLEVSIADGSIGKHDTAHIKQLLGALGLRAKLVVENETLLDETPEVLATIHRTMVTDHGDYAEITLEVGRQSRSTSF
ncbi:MAG: hypothetical protein J7L23_01850, partial [Candidatus Diapherotrites archaeon]|nr:hypothetical protein [Candidatus Diapherotrites archaeon]